MTNNISFENKYEYHGLLTPPTRPDMFNKLASMFIKSFKVLYFLAQPSLCE